MKTPIENERLEMAAVENIEIDLLLEALLRKYGYDFRQYARGGVKRRIAKAMEKSGIERTTDLIHAALRDQDVFELLLGTLAVNVTEMFRNPSFFRAVRRIVIPELKKRNHVKVWHAGCATGEEVYSMAILLEEADMEKSVRIFATDMNKDVLNIAKAGGYPLERVEKYKANYRMAGCKHSFGDYYRETSGIAEMTPALGDKIVFAEHNLAVDGVFGEMDMIVCRNVLIYFSQELQERVVGLFADSLAQGGYLCLGSHESIAFTSHRDAFEIMSENERIYRKS